MSSSRKYVLWVRRDDADQESDAVLRERAGVNDPAVEVRTEALERWGSAVIPRGSRDEWGTVVSVVLNVGFNVLPPEGRVYLVDPA